MRYGDISFFQSGVAVPLFSLRSKNSIGVGEFLDLIPLAKWARVCGLNVIQILPVNDTGEESSPYSARSAFALNPVYINLQVIEGSAEYEADIAGMQKRTAKNKRVAYREIALWKRSILREIFEDRYSSLERNETLMKWIESNPWLKPYAVYCVLKAKNKEASWRVWKTNQDPTPASVEAFWKKNRKEVLFQAWMQFEAEGQFRSVAMKLSELGIYLKGDIPILINEDSADVWYDRKYFSLEERAGAPPDMFSHAGQNWGFPTFRWDAIGKDDYRWWRHRLVQASKFYHAYRIDHVLGFFRIWSIPEKEETGMLGYLNPSVPISYETLEKAGIKRETIEYLKSPNYSKEQLSSFLGAQAGEMITRCFGEMKGAPGRFCLLPEFESEKAILALDVPQSTIDAMLKVYWNRVFLSVPPAEGCYPTWYWYNQPVLFTLPPSEQEIIKNVIGENAGLQEALWESNALKLLGNFAAETDMLICAEDLGVVPRCVPSVLSKLNIFSLRVERWARNWDAPYSPYYEMEDYPRLSVCTTSTHDSSTLSGLWKEADFDRALYSRHAHLLNVPEKLEPSYVKEIFKNLFKANSLFCIPVIQDFLALSPQWFPENPDEERVNIPGTVGPHNWSYRLPCTVEELQKAASLNTQILSLTEERKKRLIWKI
ncbi:MAG: 4-alpha-glucanotransferase [Fibrobacter sp.]|jgi:4-alpha-glucanotransferase|nr:4-alpha-glucanotransferase [Fibrobacter sp.]